MRRATAAATKITKTTKFHKARLEQEIEISSGIIDPIPAEVEWIGRRVIGCGIAAHRVLGPGYKESIYVEAMCIEMDSRGLKFEREKPLKVLYKGVEIPGQRLDLLVERVLIVECKVVDEIVQLHTRQVTSYMKTTGVRLAFIFNFNVNVLIPTGFKRIVL